MLIPRFSIRQLLVITTALAIFFLMASLAVRGYAWAASIVVAGIALMIALTLYGLFFFAAWSVSLLLGQLRRQTTTGRSPFAQDGPPPQIIRPEEPN